MDMSRAVTPLIYLINPSSVDPYEACGWLIIYAHPTVLSINHRALAAAWYVMMAALTGTVWHTCVIKIQQRYASSDTWQDGNHSLLAIN